MQKPVGDITRQTDEGSRSKTGRWKDRKAAGQKDWQTDGHALWPFKCPFSYQQRMPAEHLQCRKRRTKRAKGSRGEQVKIGETGEEEGKETGEAASLATWLKCALGTVKANMSNIVVVVVDDVCPSSSRAAANFSICFAFQRCLHSY